MNTMKKVPFYRFQRRDPITGAVELIAGRLSRETAEQYFPGAELIPGTMRLVDQAESVPEAPYDPNSDPS